MNHELKIWPQYFARVKDGTKTFEIRNNDRGFQMGDTVLLKEYVPTQVGEPGHYTGEYLARKVGYVYRAEGNSVVFSLMPLDWRVNE
ncbi:MAG: hypothetical protein BWZ03_00075 [bacterium ADurb.BinA186]|nr:MAG: hypothetical protein BWZ03_00075 [bacterium ADurb.BinA186]